MLNFFKIGVTCFAGMSYIIYIYIPDRQRDTETDTQRDQITQAFFQ